MVPECWVCGTAEPSELGVAPQLAEKGLVHCTVVLCRACVFRPEVQGVYFSAFEALWKLRAACLALRGAEASEPLASLSLPAAARPGSHLSARLEALEGFAIALRDGLERELALRDPDRRSLWELLPAAVREQWGDFEAFEASPPSPPASFSPGLALRLLAGLRAAAQGRDK